MKQIEVFMKSHNHSNEELDFQACGACRYVVRPDDKFCRRCGANLSEQSSLPTRGIRTEPLELMREAEEARAQPPDAYATRHLAPPDVEPRRYRPVSGSLVNALVKGMADTTAGQFCGPLLKRALF